MFVEIDNFGGGAKPSLFIDFTRIGLNQSIMVYY
jgi:hypothetical protein